MSVNSSHLLQGLLFHRLCCSLWFPDLCRFRSGFVPENESADSSRSRFRYSRLSVIRQKSIVSPSEDEPFRYCLHFQWNCIRYAPYNRSHHRPVRYFLLSVSDSKENSGVDVHSNSTVFYQNFGYRSTISHTDSSQVLLHNQILSL